MYFMVDDTVSNGSLASCSIDGWGPPSIDRVIGRVELRGRVWMGPRKLSICISDLEENQNESLRGPEIGCQAVPLWHT